MRDQAIERNLKLHAANKYANILREEIPDHRKLLTFVSHCGQNSLTESVLAGVPLICIPLFGDQMRNARTAQKRNVAMILNKEDLTANSLAAALKTVIHGKSYRKSARKLSEMIRSKPVSPRERLIRNTEFVLKFGPADSFSVAGVELNFFQYFLIDVLTAVMAVLFVFCYILLRVVLYVISRLNRLGFKSKND